MKLDSQATRRFDRAQLQRFARASDPVRRRNIAILFALAGIAAGLLVVLLLRAL
jgi:hypothetical protein